MERWEAIIEGAKSLSRIVNGGANPLGMMMAAFDESGKLADSSCVCFGGFIAQVSDAESLSRKWQDIIKPHNVEYIRMTDALRFQNEFDGWKKDRRAERDELLRKLVEMARTHVAMFIATPMACSDFKDLPESHRAQLKNPQYCGFEACVKILSTTAAKLGHRLQLYCDSSEEYSATCLSLYNKLRLQNQQVKDACVAITFADDKHSPVLQLADVFASCARQDSTRQTVRPDPVIDVLLEIFKRDEAIGGFVNYKPGTGLGAAIVE